MTGKKELKIAKGMFKQSLTSDIVDTKKVRTIIKEVVVQKPAHLIRILRAYKRLLASALSKEVVVIEMATKIANLKEFEKEIKAKTHAKRIIYKTNPKIITGAKVTHGDWIYDSTLDTKLKQLTSID